MYRYTTSRICMRNTQICSRRIIYMISDLIVMTFDHTVKLFQNCRSTTNYIKSKKSRSLFCQNHFHDLYENVVSNWNELSRAITRRNSWNHTVTAMSEGDRRVDGDAIGGLEKEFVSFRAETAEICSSEHGWKPFMYALRFHACSPIAMRWPHEVSVTTCTKKNHVAAFEQPILISPPTQVAPNSRLSAHLPPHRASIARRFSDCLSVRRLELGEVWGFFW